MLPSSIGGSQEAEGNVAASLLWLECNISPWESVIEHWRNTHAFRTATARNNGNKATVRDLISKYPCLQQPNGYVLVSQKYINAIFLHFYLHPKPK